MRNALVEETRASLSLSLSLSLSVLQPLKMSRLLAEEKYETR